MKTFKLFSLILLITILFSCDGEKGKTTQTLNGDEQGLPDELKGMKLYYVSLGNNASGVKVAILPDNKLNSLTYSVGKSQMTTIIINKGRYNERTIVAKEIISETADVIVIRK
jgi:hypothetical protein